MRSPLPPSASVLAFLDAINHGDVAQLGALMAPEHRLQVLDEPPLDGRDANVEAWRGYIAAFPEYVIHPDRIVERAGGEVIVVGSTTRSHRDLADDDERQLGVIWRALVVDGLLTLWQILDDTPERRAELFDVP
jgi:ketosteroid isomerase-like protein